MPHSAYNPNKDTQTKGCGYNHCALFTSASGFIVFQQLLPPLTRKLHNMKRNDILNLFNKYQL